MRERLPDSQHLVPPGLAFRRVEQGLVQGQVLGGRGERQIEQFHAANRVLAGVYAAAAPWTFVALDLN